MLSPTERTRLKKVVSEDNKRLVEIFDTLGDANRCKLFRLVIKNPTLNVTEAARVLRLSVSLTSQHFKLLEQNKLLTKTKAGREVYYKLNRKDPYVAAIVNIIKE